MTESWNPGEKLKSPVEGMKTIDPENVGYPEVYKLMVSTIVPRPIAFVSTMSAKGVTNLAPFSFFNGVCSKPPTLLFSVARKSNGDKKDTLRNVEETGEFVVNCSSMWLTEPLVHSAGEFASDESEFDITGLTPIPAIKVKAPRVQEAGVHFECKVSKLVEIGDGSPGSATIVIGQILLAHIMDGAIDEKGYINTRVLEPLARLGGFQYASLGEIFSKKVPAVPPK